MDTTLAATVRHETGKGIARKLRAAGQVPGVVYGPEHEAVAVSVDPDALTLIFKNSGNRNTVVNLTLDGGDAVPVLVREVQRHPVKRDILHVDFYRMTERPIFAMVPVRPEGRPAGALMGGRLRLIRRQIKVRCRPDIIPEAFVVDVSPMDINDIVRVSDLTAPDGVELVYDNDYNVLTVYGKRAAVEDAAEDGEEAEDEAAE